MEIEEARDTPWNGAEGLIESSLPSSAAALSELLWDNLVRHLEGRSVRGLHQFEMTGVPLGTASARPTRSTAKLAVLRPPTTALDAVRSQRNQFLWR